MKEEAKAKKKVSKVVIIVGSVLLAIAVAVLVLCLIKVDTVNAIDGYSSVSVYDLNSTERFELVGDDYADQRVKLEKAMKKTNFSVMQGILEGKASGKLTFKKDSSGDDLVYGDNEPDEGVADTIGFNPDTNSFVNATDTQYKLEYKFAELKKITVEGEEIAFDRAIVLVGNSNNEIGTLEIVLYQYNRVGNDGTDEEDDGNTSTYYTVKPIVVNARTTALYNAIANIIKTR